MPEMPRMHAELAEVTPEMVSELLALESSLRTLGDRKPEAWIRSAWTRQALDNLTYLREVRDRG